MIFWRHMRLILTTCMQGTRHPRRAAEGGGIGCRPITFLNTSLLLLRLGPCRGQTFGRESSMTMVPTVLATKVLTSCVNLYRYSQNPAQDHSLCPTLRILV